MPITIPRPVETPAPNYITRIEAEAMLAARDAAWGVRLDALQQSIFAALLALQKRKPPTWNFAIQTDHYRGDITGMTATPKDG